MSSIPSRSVRPLQDSGIPEGPKRITNSPPTKKTTLDYYSDLPDISIFAPAAAFWRARSPVPDALAKVSLRPVVGVASPFEAPNV